MNSPIRVLVVDTEKIYRDGLKLIFARHSDIRVVGQAQSAADACEKARRLQPDVVLMETQLPDGDGITTAQRILADDGKVRVAMLTSSRADADVMGAIKAGVHGYITKDVNVGSLLDSIRRVANGEAVIPPAFAARLLQEFAELTRGRDDEMRAINADRAKVTDRECEVLRLLVQGATNRDIARKLVITENTVKVHLRNILEKLHLRNRQQAAAFAISSGLVRLAEDRPAAPDARMRPGVAPAWPVAARR